MNHTVSRLGLAAAIAWCAAAALVTAAEPHVGYIYPAGARQGATLEVTVGGQFLKDATNLYVTGGGIASRVLDYHKELTRQEIRRLRNRLQKLEPALDGKEGEERRSLEREIQDINETFVAQGYDEGGEKRTVRPDQIGRAHV